MILDDLKKHRGEVLWWEICSLLHDIGKLSSEFIDYRQKWHTIQGGYGRDPHDNDWFEGNTWHQGDLFIKEARFENLRKFFERRILTASVVSGELSVWNAVHNHTKKDPDDLAKLLKLGDGADARYDRNNPLFGCEQTNHANPGGDVFRSNVFGYEDRERTLVLPEVLNRAREELYTKLQALLSPYFNVESPELSCCDYRRIRELMQKYFEPALSDTTRPGNDTSLWEHVYSVASITKALHIQRASGEKADGAQFRIWGFGWDSMRYISFSHRIGDLLGRREVLEDIFDKAKELIEYTIPFGNAVYRDDDMLLFLTPALADFDVAVRDLQSRIVDLSVSVSEGELAPHFAVCEPVQSLTRVVEVIGKLRKQARFPVSEGAANLAGWFQRNWMEAGRRSVCSVCRMRPAKRNQENCDVCGKCMERRRNRTESFDLHKDPAQTPMIKEIAEIEGGRSNRAALIVAKFDLTEWLNGRMVRTLFITESDSIGRSLEAIPHFKDAAGDSTLQDNRDDWTKRHSGFQYADIRRMVLEDCEKGTDKESLFLFEQPFVANEENQLWLRDSRKGDPAKAHDRFIKGIKALLDDAEKEHPEELKKCGRETALVNLLCAKTPTPSTVLDVWETAQEFLKGIAGPRYRYGHSETEPVLVEEPSLLEEMADKDTNDALKLHRRCRAYVEVEVEGEGEGDMAGLNEHETFNDSDLSGAAHDVVYEGRDRRFWVVGVAKAKESWKQLTITPDDGKPRTFRILKAGQKEAYYPYRQISASPNLLLLLVPADSAVEVTQRIYERYIREFGKAYGRLPFSVGNIFFQSHTPMYSVLDAARRMERSFNVRQKELRTGPAPRMLALLPALLGDGTKDWHHPYAMTKDKLTGKESYFETIMGSVVRMAEVGDDIIHFHPNHYDGVMLGASSDRFQIGVTGGDNMLESCPILLDELEERVIPLWDALRDATTDSSLRNLEQLLAGCYETWRKGDEAAARQAIVELAIPAVRSMPGRSRDLVIQAIRDGFFFQTLNLYLRILKQRIEKGEDDGDSNEALAIPAAIIPG